MDGARRETHTAVVTLLGDRAYKVKKPVRLAFLDFSTRAARATAAAREVALNRRLAPDVYLGVGEWRGPDEPPGAPGEPVVVMRRLPDDRRLATLVTHRRAHPDTLADPVRAIARRVAAFHARAERSDAIATAGHPEVVAAKFRTDAQQTHALVRDLPAPAPADGPGPAPAEQVARIAGLGAAYLAGRTTLLDDRVRAGLVVDGHGDLLADDIFCLDDGPRILDCLEFDDRLRWGDVLADVAFLAMDLEHLGAPTLAAQLLADYATFSGTHHPPSLAHFHVAARALVRAKVAALRARQAPDTDAADAARRDACTLLDLARRHLERGRVVCVLVGGGPGSGKSTLARAIAPELDAVVLASDEVRKELAGLPHDAAGPAAYLEGLYTDARTDATYAELLARARTLLTRGVSVVLDATWTRAAHRDAARLTAATTHSGYRELECVASPRVAEARVGWRRASGPGPSDATPAVAAALRADADPWPTAVRLDADAPSAVVRTAARRALRQPDAGPGAGPGASAPTTSP